jgi:hypothetical protein
MQWRASESVLHKPLQFSIYRLLWWTCGVKRHVGIPVLRSHLSMDFLNGGICELETFHFSWSYLLFLILSLTCSHCSIGFFFPCWHLLSWDLFIHARWQACNWVTGELLIWLHCELLPALISISLKLAELLLWMWLADVYAETQNRCNIKISNRIRTTWNLIHYLPSTMDTPIHAVGKLPCM